MNLQLTDYSATDHRLGHSISVGTVCVRRQKSTTISNRRKHKRNNSECWWTGISVKCRRISAHKGCRCGWAHCEFPHSNDSNGSGMVEDQRGQTTANLRRICTFSSDYRRNWVDQIENECWSQHELMNFCSNNKNQRQNWSADLFLIWSSFALYLLSTWTKPYHKKSCNVF